MIESARVFFLFFSSPFTGYTHTVACSSPRSCKFEMALWGAKKSKKNATDSKKWTSNSNCNHVLVWDQADLKTESDFGEELVRPAGKEIFSSRVRLLLSTKYAFENEFFISRQTEAQFDVRARVF